MDTMLSLRELQHEFMAALYDPAAPGPVAAIAGNGLTAAGRLRIYRSSCEQSHVTTLRVTYPVVLALVGDAFFDQTARGYRRAYPSRSGNLQAFGAKLGDYLETLPACRPYPYLPDVARLEWLRQEAILAPAAAAIAPAAFAGCTTADDARLRLTLHPSLHLAGSSYPILRIWQYALHPANDRLTLDDNAGECVALWRDDDEVAMGVIDVATFACVAALQRGATVDDAQAAAITVDPDFDLAECVRTLIERGVVTGFDTDTFSACDLKQ
ncbi:MAG TPA: DNA-binding domain-containing protein [Nevskiaceae bacterium]|nr:DNA-binding domain-containing protein [Nevskiaceae bacterium]